MPAHQSLMIGLAGLLLLASLVVDCNAQWSVPKKPRGKQGPIVQAPEAPSPPAEIPETEEDSASELDSRYEGVAIHILEPEQGSTINSTPFRVRMSISGPFKVPEDGEVQLIMTYEGRGGQVRTLQSLDFNSWNVLDAPLEIRAQLITTKDEPVGEPATVQVQQVRGSHFVLNSPTDGQLYVARSAVPVLFMYGGAVPDGAKACVVMQCTKPGDDPKVIQGCTDTEGVDITVQDGQYRMDLQPSPGNCSLSASVLDAQGSAISRVHTRYFRIVDDQAECPSGSGTACLHGECSGDGEDGFCLCDYGYEGKSCISNMFRQTRATGISGSYLHLVKAALLDNIYAKDRPGETKVVARSMVGQQGLDDLQGFVESILSEQVEGDLMETGVWQGGSCILMKAVLKAHGVTDRKIWVADSFEGCPPPDPENYPQDTNDQHHTYTNLQIPLHKVASNFADFGLLDDQVEFVRGWFHDTMYGERVQQIESLALLRLDGDLYQSTIEVLRAMYHKISLGGYVVVDDWRLDGMQARSAVIDFHTECGLRETIRVGEDGLAWWRKMEESSCG